MKLSEVIKELEKLKREKGDVPLKIFINANEQHLKFEYQDEKTVSPYRLVNSPSILINLNYGF